MYVYVGRWMQESCSIRYFQLECSNLCSDDGFTLVIE